MLQKILHGIFIVLALGTLCYIAVQTYREPTLMTTENRPLSPQPLLPHRLTELESFVQGVEAWWGDAIHFRQQFIQLFNKGRAYLGISPQKEVVVGKDGWLFFSGEGSVDDYRNTRLFTPEELHHWKNYLLFRHLDAEKRGAVYVFFVVPNKERIYGEYLPNNFSQLSTTTRFDQIINTMRDTPVHILDIRPALIEAKKSTLIYDKTDTHWNLIGANVAQFTLMQYLRTFYPDIEVQQYNNTDYYFSTAEPFMKTGMPYASGLTYALGIIDPYLNEPQPIFRNMPLVFNCIQPGTFVLHENYSLIADVQKKNIFQAETCKTGKHRVFMIRDSFTDALKPYLSSTFNYIFYLWMSRPSGLFDWNYFMDTLKPDIVLDETVERYLIDVPQPGGFYPSDFDTK